MVLEQITWLFFRFSGRVSRAAYLLAGLLMMVIVMFFIYRMVDAQEQGLTGSVWETGFSIALLISLWAQAALGAKRLHDIGRPGIFSVLLFIPALNFITFVALCILPGTPGANRYGAVTNAPA